MSNYPILYGNAAISLLKELTKSYEFYCALYKPKEEWDEYDSMILPIWIKVMELLDEYSI